MLYSQISPSKTSNETEEESKKQPSDFNIEEETKINRTLFENNPLLLNLFKANVENPMESKPEEGIETQQQGGKATKEGHDSDEIESDEDAPESSGLKDEEIQHTKQEVSQEITDKKPENSPEMLGQERKFTEVGMLKDQSSSPEQSKTSIFSSLFFVFHEITS